MASHVAQLLTHDMVRGDWNDFVPVLRTLAPGAVTLNGAPKELQ
jgi:hypothetical protein